MQQLPLIARAAAHAGRIAVRTPGQQRTYQEVLQRSGSIASTLLAASDDLSEARVAYLLPADLDYITTQWGIWRAGGIAVPLSLSATENELAEALADSQPSIVVTNCQLSSKLAPLCDDSGLRLVLVDDVQHRSSTSLPQIDSQRRAMILFTSGTTSKPKGVVTTHACIQAQIEALVAAWQWRADDRIPLFLPLHHIHGIVNVMSCALWSGAEIEPFARFDTSVILRRVAEGAYSVFMAVPTIYVKLIAALEALPHEARQPIVAGFANMRLMICGSAALPASVHEKWTQLTGQKLLERYGMTEIGMALSNPYTGERRPGAVGQPLPGVEIRLMTEQGDVVTEEGVVGEIQVRGPSVFLEYWNRSEATREAFVEGWFRTGDMGVLEDGYYRIMGRSSIDIIKSGGYKLSALEIEAVLLDHPAISACAVVGLADKTWGEIVAVAVVLRNAEYLDLDALREWCNSKISPYKIPRRLLVVDELPCNTMGKVTKPAVVNRFEGGA